MDAFNKVLTTILDIVDALKKFFEELFAKIKPEEGDETTAA